VVGIGKAPRFVSGREELDAELFEATLWVCPHCGRVGTLVGHGLLVGYAEDGVYPVVRGRRFFCSNRHRRPGCGRTLSVLLDDMLRGFVVRALTLFDFVVAVLAGASRQSAWQRATRGTLSVSSGYRLWRRLVEVQTHIRARVARLGTPPPSVATEPWAQLLAHLCQTLGPRPFPAFQHRFQVGLLG
jgi:hypothetical protein